MVIIAIIGIYVVYKKDDFLVNKFLPYFKNLQAVNKFTLGLFTILFAIPNKFWINVEINFIVMFLISALVYLLGVVFPIFFFFYGIYIILCIESFMFGLFYEKLSFFKQFTNFVLFGNSKDTFSKELFQLN